MIFHKETYERWAGSPRYPFFLGFLAFLLVGTGVLPFELVYVPALAAAPKRWKGLMAGAVIGSSLGAVCLAMLFRFLGWPLVQGLLPSLGTGQGWARAVDWMDSYGAFALIPMAALPVAQVPALAIAGFLQISGPKVLTAFLIGKSIKYSLVSWGVLEMENTVGPAVNREILRRERVKEKKTRGAGKQA